MTTDTQNEVLQYLLQDSKNGKLMPGTITATSKEFKIHPVTIVCLWRIECSGERNSSLHWIIEVQKTGRRGRSKDRSQINRELKNLNTLNYS